MPMPLSPIHVSAFRRKFAAKFFFTQILESKPFFHLILNHHFDMSALNNAAMDRSVLDAQVNLIFIFRKLIFNTSYSIEGNLLLNNDS